MKKILLHGGRYIFAGAVLVATVTSINACTPSGDTCPEVNPVPAIGPNMCNLRADRVKVKETVDTCNLLVQGDAYVRGDLRVEGIICNGSEPIEGSEQEQGILIITSQQFRSAAFSDPLLLFPPLTSCQPDLMLNPPVLVGFPIPADFDENASIPIVIDVHFIGSTMGMGTEPIGTMGTEPIGTMGTEPIGTMGTGAMGTGLFFMVSMKKGFIGIEEVVHTVTPYLSITHNGDMLMPLMPAPSSNIDFAPNRYQIEPAFVVLPAGSGNLPGDLVQFAMCIEGTLDPSEAPQVVAITVRYPKIDV